METFTGISVVIPVYNEDDNVLELYKKIKSIMSAQNKAYEIIFIDDGSNDNTFQDLSAIHENDDRVKILRFRNNFGKAAALSKGFEYAKGNIVITMDGDLQDDPEEIPNFLDKINEGYDLVSGWKYDRKDPITKTIPSKIFNILTRKITGVHIHDFNCGFKAYRSDVTKSIRIYGELHRYIPVIAFWKGYRVGEIKVKHHARRHGKSKYGSRRLLKGFLDLITIKFLSGFSARPLHFFGTFGFLFFVSGFIICLYLTIMHVLFIFEGVPEWEIRMRPLLLMGTLLIISGIQLISVGLIGEMIYSLSKDDNTSMIIEVLE